MTDKVELIKAKVEEKINLYERLLNAGKGGGAGLMSKIVALQGVLIDINFIQIDSLPEEPVNKVWHDATEEPVEEEYPIIVIDSANCVYLIDKDDSEPFDSKDKWLSVHDILPKKDGDEQSRGVARY